MTPAQLKAEVNRTGESPHFFTRKTMKFFGDSMRNYGVRRATIRAHYNTDGEYCAEGVSFECWELYRKRPVKHGLNSSAYFCASTFKRVHPIRDTEA